ncbi:hypothetical protein MUK42_02285, partial [Musa troglodytarum]
PCVTPRLWILSNYAVNCDRKVPSSDPSDGPYHGVTIGGDPIPCRRTFWPHDTGGTLPLSLVGQKGRIRETCYKPRNSLCSRRVLSVERRRRRRLRRRHGNAPTGAASFPFSYDLSVKTRELFLKNKAEELDREMGLIRTQEETGRHVKDTGCGISPQDLPHLFTKFAQGRNVASRGFSGSGLGLAICKRYVSLMQGHIWLESEGIGKGCMATFVVKLGICENPDGSQQKIVPLPWAKHGQEDTSSSRGMPKDPKAFIPLKPRYQRSV